MWAKLPEGQRKGQTLKGQWANFLHTTFFGPRRFSSPVGPKHLKNFIAVTVSCTLLGLAWTRHRAFGSTDSTHGTGGNVP